MFEFLKKRASQNDNIKVIRAPLPYLTRNLLAVFTFVVFVYLSFQVGVYWTSQVAQQRDRLLEEKQRLDEALQLEKVQHAATRIENQTIQQAVQEVRQTNVRLQQQISGLEEEVAYYQRVLNPVTNDKGLRIDDFRLEATSDSDRFRINVVLTQLGKENRTVTQGTLDISIEGSQQGEKQVYPLSRLSLNDSDLAAKFRFRYYQEISEELRLPEGFVPEKIKLVAQATGKKAMRVERIENWQYP